MKILVDILITPLKAVRIVGYAQDKSVYVGSANTDSLLTANNLPPSFLEPRYSQALRNHSPDGFAWGYPGSGPAQLALAILLRYIPANIAQEHYQDFKREYLVALPPDSDFDITINIYEWLEKKLKGE